MSIFDERLADTMRTTYTEVLKKLFRNHVIVKRMQQNMSQAKMAELLEMSERSYADIESGKSCCSAVTLMIYCCDDVQGVINELKERMENINENIA
ncbi:MAG: helix-turn-helix domain-containing protein [Faecalibacterium sp.]|nr:helix-turn-helix domain-containing protein [Ruminococcus sp.]MCM1391515.1 helix-turn-helix domain-containing protein [Ruminococcus sp.]MCM1485503.1 helix-turn-helix domain-containing protein [Faecalibacterium sp.]